MDKKDFKELIKTNDKGHISRRESSKLEFKENFHGNAISEYAKTMIAFANNSGGIIVFGVSDSPRYPKGMKNTNFQKFDNAKITSFLNEYYSPSIQWDSFEFAIDEKTFGVIVVNEAIHKPIMCRKNTPKNIAFEGEIFYRYSGRSEKIKYTDLAGILDERRVHEQKKWMEHIEKIAKIGPTNIALIDILRGEISSSSDKKIVIDKNIIKDIKFIEEGKFTEKDGEGLPTLKLVGEVEGMETLTPNLNLEDDFYTTKELGRELGLLTDKGSTYYVTLAVQYFEIQKEPKYYQTKGNQKFYTQTCLEFLREKELSLVKIKELTK